MANHANLHQSWESIEHFLSKDLALIWEKKSLQVLSSFYSWMSDCASYVEQLYKLADEDRTPQQDLQNSLSDLHHLIYQLESRNIAKIDRWWADIRKVVQELFSHISLLVRLYESQENIPQRSDGTLLQQFKSRSIFDVVFHQIGNSRTIQDRSVQNGVDIVMSYAQRLGTKPRTLCRQIRLTLDSDYLWMYSDERSVAQNQQGLSERDKKIPGRNAVTRLHAYFAHPDNPLKGFEKREDVLSKKKKGELARPEQVIGNWNTGILLGVELKGGPPHESSSTKVYDTHAISYLLDLCRKKGIERSNLICQSNNPKFLSLVKELCPDVPTMIYNNLGEFKGFGLFTPPLPWGYWKKWLPAHLPSIKRIKSLQDVDIYAEITFPKTLREFYQKVKQVEQWGMLYFSAINYSEKRAGPLESHEICKRLARAYFCGASGSIIELENASALSSLHISFQNIQATLIEGYQRFQSPQVVFYLFSTDQRKA